MREAIISPLLMRLFGLMLGVAGTIGWLVGKYLDKEPVRIVKRSEII